jgi:hypothetical protein
MDDSRVSGDLFELAVGANVAEVMDSCEVGKMNRNRRQTM